MPVEEKKSPSRLELVLTAFVLVAALAVTLIGIPTALAVQSIRLGESQQIIGKLQAQIKAKDATISVLRSKLNTERAK